MERVDLGAVLARCARAHGLAEPVPSVEDAVRRAAGIYGATPTCYLSLAARVRGFEIRRLEDALYERRSLVRVPAMRGSGYVLPRDLVPHGLALGSASSAARWYLPTLQKAGLTEGRVAKLTDAIMAMLSERPRTAAEIRKGLKGWKDPFPQALSLLLRRLSHTGHIVGTRVRGTWRSQLYEYARLRDWVDIGPELPTLEEALGALAPLYFEANGPATLGDFAWWAGIREATAEAAAEKLRLEPVTVEGLAAVHFATKPSLYELSSPPDDGPVNLIPVWDAYVMAQTDRSRYLDPRRKNRVVDRSGNVTSTVLRGGRVVGIWDVVGGTLRFAPFEPIRLREIDEAAERFRSVLEIRAVKELRVPGPLDARGQNAFMSPLK